MFRKLYWADKGGNSIQPKIAVMNMDGSQPRTINKRRVEVPEGLAIDRSNNDLYWSDSGKGWVSDCMFRALNIFQVYQDFTINRRYFFLKLEHFS